MPNMHLQAERIVAFDLKPVDLRPPYTQVVAGDIFDIDRLLPEQTFDTILMGELIEHLERPYDALRLLRNRLNPGGRLILSTPNPLGLPVCAAEYLLLRRIFYTAEHVFYFTPRWVWRLLEHSGYRILKTKGCGASLAGWWVPAPISLSYLVIYVATPA